MLHDQPLKPDRPALAVLVDGDNVAADHAEQVLAFAAKHGRVTVARVYANTQGFSNWQDTVGYRLLHTGTGKNAADILLTIDAMELALTSGISAFILASSDSDFTHLALRLRELGHQVQGIGEAKAPPGFRAACAGFALLDAPTCEMEVTGFDQQIRSMIAMHSQQGRGMRITDLSVKMRTSHGAQISSRPEKTWRGYLSKRPHLFQLDPKGPEAMVRFLPKGFGTLA
ncbi:NYN domain-containing protein [Antarctobacter sp.]|uniref:NYN domain-containing protein n=1 Tax=Antarctobacter sp. TaxID=1872577 RepID=UPI002B2682DE|nr:NYN domain-containing protein [Antarctobacter sp.]